MLAFFTQGSLKKCLLERGDLCKDFLSVLHIFRARSKAGWKREVLLYRNSHSFS